MGDNFEDKVSWFEGERELIDCEVATESETGEVLEETARRGEGSRGYWERSCGGDCVWVWCWYPEEGGSDEAVADIDES